MQMSTAGPHTVQSINQSNVCECIKKLTREPANFATTYCLFGHTQSPTTRLMYMPTDLDIPDPEFGALVGTTRNDVRAVWTPREVRHSIRVAVKHVAP